jgi:hypothetical protein
MWYSASACYRQQCLYKCTDFVTSNGRAVCEWWMIKYVKGNPGLFKILSRNFPRRIDQNKENAIRIGDHRVSIRSVDLQKRIRNNSHSTAKYNWHYCSKLKLILNTFREIHLLDVNQSSRIHSHLTRQLIFDFTYSHLDPMNIYMVLSGSRLQPLAWKSSQLPRTSKMAGIQYNVILYNEIIIKLHKTMATHCAVRVLHTPVVDCANSDVRSIYQQLSLCRHFH